MNKKIFTIFALLIVVTSISAVSAFDFGDLFGMNQNQTVTVGGVDFNVPNGYKEDSSNPFEIIAGFEDEGYEFDGKVYIKDNTQVGMFVYNYSSSADEDDFLSNFANETSINGVGGYLEVADDIHLFAYTKDKVIVLVASNDESAISEFIIA